jgi:hypothetical protein
MVRYLDDMVFVFQNHSDAERFYKTLPKRLGKYGLELNLETATRRLFKGGVQCTQHNGPSIPLDEPRGLNKERP